MKRQGLVGLVAIAATCSAIAGKPVYKCVDGGKTSYSNVPCLEAVVIDTTPTQGLDKSSGKSIKGADVRAEQHRQYMSEHLYKPLFGETAEDTNKRHRRSKLAPEDRTNCYRLDPLMKSEKGQALLDVRMKYHAQNC